MGDGGHPGQGLGKSSQLVMKVLSTGLLPLEDKHGLFRTGPQAASLNLFLTTVLQVLYLAG